VAASSGHATAVAHGSWFLLKKYFEDKTHTFASRTCHRKKVCVLSSKYFLENNHRHGPRWLHARYLPPPSACNRRPQPPSPRLTAVGYGGWFSQACNQCSGRRLVLQPPWVAAVRHGDWRSNLQNFETVVYFSKINKKCLPLAISLWKSQFYRYGHRSKSKSPPLTRKQGETPS
jgi:hypothetical protein